MRWTDWFERGWPAIVCVALAAAAYFQAQGIAAIIATSVDAPPPVRSPRVKPRARTEPVDADPILERNPFDSEVGPLDGTAPAELVTAPEPTKPPAPVDPLKAPKCDFGHVKLILSAREGYGFASIQGKDRKSSLYRVGDMVDDHRLSQIGWDRVWLEDDGSPCQMRLADKAPKRPKRKRARRRRRRRRRATSRLPKSIRDKINKVGENEYVVDRSVVDEVLEQQAQLMKSVRLRPVKKGSDVVGLRVSRVRGGTLLDVIGVKRGDTIQSINGFDLTNPQKALEAYGRLRTASNLTLQLQRRGKPVTIEYRVQ